MEKLLESLELQLVMKSGKYMLRYKQTLKMNRQGKTKLTILVSNCPALRESEIEYYAMLHWPKLVFITAVAIILHSNNNTIIIIIQHMENTTESAHWPSQNRLVKSKPGKYSFN